MGPYDDIIDLPHPTSTKHPRMPLADRAAQFSPFAALSGHEAAIRETARLTDRRVELDEDEQAVLDLKLRLIGEHILEWPEVTIIYFAPDKKKAGGSYEEAVGPVRKIDDFKRTVVLEDGQSISIDEIYEIECDLPYLQF